LKDQREVDHKGGTMRLGTYTCLISPGSLANTLYGRDMVLERHRHRYEVNPRYHRALSEAGLKFSGTSPDGRLVEMIEIPEHPFFIASQFHPEFKSRPTAAHPLFRGVIKAALERATENNRADYEPSPLSSNGTGHDEGTGTLNLTLDDIRRSMVSES
jgi:CTP synthase